MFVKNFKIHGYIGEQSAFTDYDPIWKIGGLNI